MTLWNDLRKTVVLILVIVVFVHTGFSDDTKPQLTFASESGLAFIYGEAKEIVYKSSSGTDLLSLLVYPIPPGIGVYVGMETRWRESLIGRIRLETAWPVMSGNLTDDDWEYGNSSTNIPDVHSDSTAYLTSWLHGELEFGFPDGELPSTIETLLGLKFRQMSWEGWDAFQTPAPSNFPDGDIFGFVIDYRQTWLIPWIGLNIGHKKTDSAFSVSFRFSPWMFVVGRDVHMARPIPATFIDVMSGGVMVAGGLSGEIRLTGNLWLTGKISLDYSSGARGNTYIYEIGDPDPIPIADTGGAALSLFSSYLGFSVHP